MIFIAMEINRRYIQLLSLLLLLFTVQFSFGQRLLLLQDKIKNDHYVVEKGKRIKIKTIDKQKIKGKLITIKDNSLVLQKRNIETEIPIHKIRYFYVRTPGGWKTAGGIFLAVSSLDMTGFVLIGLSSNKKSKNKGTKVNDNPIPGLAIVGVIGLPALYAGTYYGLLHRRKFDVKMRYNLMVIKPK